MDSSSPILGLVNYGVLGLLVVGLALGFFWVKPSVDNLKEQIATLRAERDAQIATLRLERDAQVRDILNEREKMSVQLRAERDRALTKVDAMADVYNTSLLPGLNKFLTTIEILMPLLQRQAERSGGDSR